MASPIDLLESLMSEEDLAEDLRDWFGKGKKGGVGGGGWDRYNTKGERIGKCAAPDRGATEGKPKCLSKEKAAQLRAKGGKKAIANAVKRKKAQDPVTDRPGTGNVPKYVSSRIKEASDEEAHVFTPEFEEVLHEKNVPTNPTLWSRAKAEAKKRFDVYPSAYANGWAAKWYKERGGGWRTKKNESNTPSDREWGTKSLVDIYKKDTPGEELDEFFGMDFIEVGPDLVQSFKKSTPGQTPMHEAHDSLLDVIFEAARPELTEAPARPEKVVSTNVWTGREHVLNNPYLDVLDDFKFVYNSSTYRTGGPKPAEHYYTRGANFIYVVIVSGLGMRSIGWRIQKLVPTTGDYETIISSRDEGNTENDLKRALGKLFSRETGRDVGLEKGKPRPGEEQAKQGPYHELLAQAGFQYYRALPPKPPATKTTYVYQAEAGPSQKTRIKAFRIDVLDNMWQFYEVTLGGNIAKEPIEKGSDKTSLERLIRKIKAKNWIRSLAQAGLRGAVEKGGALGKIVGALTTPTTVSSR